MIRRPPRSTLFPTRRSSDLSVISCTQSSHASPWPSPDSSTACRSEEHTSELQSRLHLVCRLLLEKKKKKHKNILHQVKNIEHTNNTHAFLTDHRSCRSDHTR